MEQPTEPLHLGKVPSMARIKALISLLGAVVVLLCLAGCASNPNHEFLVDPLKQRLIAREDIALQNMLFARTPAYSGGGYFDEPYDGPIVEPPLPDLNLLPADLPPWEDVAKTSGDAGAAPEPALLMPLPEEAQDAAPSGSDSASSPAQP